MGKAKSTVMIPSEERFIKNKYVSDLIYMWVLLNGKEEDDGTFSIPKKSRKAYVELGINYRTFYREIQELVNCGFLEDNPKDSNRYILYRREYDFKRYISKRIMNMIYETKEKNLLKLYIYLASMYDYNQKRKQETFFRPNIILEALGYSGGANRSSKMEKKVMGLVKKLADMKLITYHIKYEPTDHRYKVLYILTDVVKR